MLSAWLHLGDGPALLRLPSALSMAGAAALVFLATRTLFGSRTALWATVIFVLSPHGLYWAQKARPYAFQTLWVALSFWGLARLFTSSAARRTLRDPGWPAYAIGGGLAMLSQHPAGFFVLGANAAALLLILSGIRRNAVFLRNWIVAQLVLIAIWLTWFPFFLDQVRLHLTPSEIGEKHGIFLIDPAQLLGILSDLLGVAHLWRLQPAATLLYAALVAAALVRLARTRPTGGLVVLTAAIPILVCVALYFALNPTFGYVIYTFNWLLVPYAALVALGVEALPRLLRAAALAAILLLNAWGLRNEFQESPPPLDQAAALIDSQLQPGDAIVFSADHATRYALAYYLRPRLGTLPGLDASRDGDTLITTPAQAAIARRTWVILPTDKSAAVQPPGTPAFTAQLDRLTVTRFDRN